MSKIFFAALLSLGVMTGCVGAKMKMQFEASLQYWVGRPDSELLAQNLPNKNLQITIHEKRSGGKIFTIESWQVYEDVNPDRRKYSLGCFRIFEADATGRIVSARYEGAGGW